MLPCHMMEGQRNNSLFLYCPRATQELCHHLAARSPAEKGSWQYFQMQSQHPVAEDRSSGNR